MNETEIIQWWSGLNGFSEAKLTKEHAIISNGCFTNPYGTVTLHESVVGTVEKKAKELTKGNDFYCRFVLLVLHPDNQVRSMTDPVKDEDVMKEEKHMLLLHPRQYTNIFHILEGSSTLLRLAIHPELFPNVHSSLFMLLRSPT